MKRKAKILALAGVLCCLSSFPVYAAWEQQVDSTWKYKDDSTGAYLAGQWIESQSEKGVWYYLDETGVMVTDTVIDGFYIDGNGEWREGSQQQTQPTPSTQTQPSQSNQGNDDLTSGGYGGKNRGGGQGGGRGAF